MRARQRKYLVIGSLALLFTGLLAFLVPNAITARTCSAQNACANNLRCIDGAKQLWLLQDCKDTNGPGPTMQDLQPYVGGPMVCPEGGTYIPGRIGKDPKCSIGGRHSIPN